MWVQLNIQIGLFTNFHQVQGRHTYNFCSSKRFYLRYTFCKLSIYLSKRVYVVSKMAQSNMHKTNLKLIVESCSQMVQSSEPSLLFNCKCFFCVWLLKQPFLFDYELMIGEILTKSHELIQSFLGFLRYESASLVKSTMPISCLQTFRAIGQKSSDF